MATERVGEELARVSGPPEVAEEGLREARARFGRFWNGRAVGLPSAALALAGAAWRALGDQIATRLHRPNLGHLGAGSRIGAGGSIRYPGRISLGAGVWIGRRVSFSSEIPEGRLEIGDGTFVDVDCVLDFTGHLAIGRDCTISARTRFFSHDHGVSPRSEPAGRVVRIGDRVWIGTASVILQNAAEIGDDAVIAAGSVVTKPVPPRTLVAGSPARVVRELDPAS